MSRSPLALPLLATELFAFFGAAAAPSPMLVLLGREFGFGTATLTVIFAVYAIALLVALLVAGALSDHVGRKPVLLAALVVQSGSMLTFLAADGVGWLIAGRVIQGLATGIAVGALTAAIVEAAPRESRIGPLVNGSAPLAGLATGAVASAWMVQQVTDPVRATFLFLLAVFVVAAGLTWLIPETSGRRDGAWASLVPRIAVPPAARRPPSRRSR